MTDHTELLKLREEREKANEAQRIWKLRAMSDTALETRKQAALQRVKDIEKVQKEREDE